jgi:hypothetical protein
MSHDTHNPQERMKNVKHQPNDPSAHRSSGVVIGSRRGAEDHVTRSLLTSGVAYRKYPLLNPVTVTMRR